jgi:hypothetical protein
MRLSGGLTRGLALVTASAAACTLVPLDGLTGGAGGAQDASTSESGSTDGGGKTDAPVATDATDAGNTTDAKDATSDAADAGSDAHAAKDSQAPTDAPAEAKVDAGSVYAATVKQDAPLAYWRVDEPSGTVALDHTGHGHDASYVGGVTLRAAGAILNDPDTAITLDGTTGHVDASDPDAGDAFAFLGTAPMSLEAWVLPTGLTPSYQRVFSHEPVTSPREGYLMYVRSTNGDPSTFSLERWSDGGVDQCPTTAPVTEGTWHHLVATYDGTTSTVYLDGTVVAASASVRPLFSATASLLMGLGTYDPAPFTGSLDEIAIYDASLSAARVTAHYHASGR